MKNRRHFVRAFADGTEGHARGHTPVVVVSPETHLQATLQATGYMSSTDEAPYRSHVLHDTTRPADLYPPQLRFLGLSSIVQNSIGISVWILIQSSRPLMRADDTLLHRYFNQPACPLPTTMHNFTRLRVALDRMPPGGTRAARKGAWRAHKSRLKRALRRLCGGAARGEDEGSNCT